VTRRTTIILAGAGLKDRIDRRFLDAYRRQSAG
jgi:hypothetical protein